MSIKDAILNTSPTSYWPLDDLDGLSCHDEIGLHDASVPTQGVTLAVIPFGTSQAPYFDGAHDTEPRLLRVCRPRQWRWFQRRRVPSAQDARGLALYAQPDAGGGSCSIVTGSGSASRSSVSRSPASSLNRIMFTVSGTSRPLVSTRPLRKCT